MKTVTVAISILALLLLGSGLSVYAIGGGLTLVSAGLLWAGLMLMLFLLYARFAEIRSIVTSRSAKYGTNMAVMVTVFFAVIVFAAILGDAHKARFDLTAAQRFSISSQTVKLLKGLQEPVKAIAFYRMEANTLHAQQRQAARDLLEEYASIGDKFSFTFIDPDSNPGLASKYGVSEYRIILLVSGDKQVKVGNESEEKLTNGLIRLVKQTTKVVYFVTGHGEKDVTSEKKNGYSNAIGAIANENYKVQGLKLMQVDKVPDDAAAVVIISPERELAEAELDKLNAYYVGGGALLVMIDPGHPPMFRTWLEKFGFKLQDDVIIDKQSQVYGANNLTPVVYSYNKQHPLTQNFTLATYFPIANSVFLDEDYKKGMYQLAMSGPSSWTETDRKQLESGEAEYNEDHEKRGPLPVMAVTTVAVKGAETPDGVVEDRYGKFVLIGDSDFANNTNISLAGNGDLFLNTINWLCDEANLIAVRAKKQNVSPVILTASQGRAIFWVPVVMIPAAVLMTGLGIYSRRRWFR